MGTGNTGIYVIPDAALIGLLLYYHLTLKADMTAAKLHLSTARLPDSGHPFLHAAPRPCSSSITPTVSGPAEANETGRCDWLGAASARSQEINPTYSGRSLRRAACARLGATHRDGVTNRDGARNASASEQDLERPPSGNLERKRISLYANVVAISNLLCTWLYLESNYSEAPWADASLCIGLTMGCKTVGECDSLIRS